MAVVEVLDVLNGVEHGLLAGLVGVLVEALPYLRRAERSAASSGRAMAKSAPCFDVGGAPLAADLDGKEPCLTLLWQFRER